MKFLLNLNAIQRLSETLKKAIKNLKTTFDFYLTTEFTRPSISKKCNKMNNFPNVIYQFTESLSINYEITSTRIAPYSVYSMILSDLIISP